MALDRTSTETTKELIDFDGQRSVSFDGEIPKLIATE